MGDILANCKTHCNAFCNVQADTMRGMMENEIGPGGRLRHYRIARGYDTILEFAAVLGIPPSTIAGHETGHRGITSKAAKRYGRVLRIKPEALLYGTEFNQVAVNTETNLSQGVATVHVPLLSSSDIEQFTLIASGAIPMSDDTIPLPHTLAASKRTASFLMPDKSMEAQERKNIGEGDGVIFDPEEAYGSGDFVAVLAPGFSTIIVRKYRITNIDSAGARSFDLVPLDLDYPSFKDAHLSAEIKIVGKVIAAIRVF